MADAVAVEFVMAAARKRPHSGVVPESVHTEEPKTVLYKAF